MIELKSGFFFPWQKPNAPAKDSDAFCALMSKNIPNMQSS